LQAVAVARLLLFLALACATSAQAAVDDELRAIEDARRDAIKRQDFDALARIYAPGFVAIAGNGELIDRPRLFAVFRQTDPAFTFATDEIRVLDLGATAVFLGRLTARNAAGNVVSVSRFSHTFVREGGQWRCVYGQSTPVAAR
jgi:ketosteroid isomerase-like protein